jgi:hypothetical protein
MERSNTHPKNYFQKQNTMTYKTCFKHIPISEFFEAPSQIDGCQRDKGKGQKKV